jgi:hypothetical protein
MFGFISNIKEGVLLALVIVLGMASGYFAYEMTHEKHQRELKEKDLNASIYSNQLCQFQKSIQNHAILDQALDFKRKEADYNATMAAKPKERIKIKYVDTGVECKDLQGIIDEAMADNNNTGAVQ